MKRMIHMMAIALLTVSIVAHAGKTAKKPKSRKPASDNMKVALKHLEEVRRLLRQIRMENEGLKSLEEVIEREGLESSRSASASAKAEFPSKELSDLCMLESLDGMRRCLAKSIRELAEFSESIADEIDVPLSKIAVPGK